MMNYFCSVMAMAGLECETPVSYEVQQAFVQHMSEFGLSYGTTEEFQYRLGIYAKKDAFIQETNANQDSFTVGHNKFSTWSDSEYKKLLGYKGKKANNTKNVKILPTANLADSVDWRTKGAVNAVKDQGQWCRSGWAFSAICAMEGAHFLKTGELLSLAEQQIVDCDFTSNGCNGGWQSHAFRYAESHPVELESAYPYTARDGTCVASASKGKVDATGYTNVKVNSVDQLKAAIAQAPTSVTIEADTMVFQMYTGGVLDSTYCGTNLDHAVTAVGYGTESGKEYYLVRNSWGSSWGEEGYIKIAAVDGQGICGIQEDSLYPSTD